MIFDKKRGFLFLSAGVWLLCSWFWIRSICFFFGVGLSGNRIKRSLSGVLRLHPDSGALTATLILLYTGFIVASRAVSSLEIGAEGAVLLLLMAFTKNDGNVTARESFCFSFAVVSSGLACAVAIYVTGRITPGFYTFFYVLFAWAAAVSFFSNRDYYRGYERQKKERPMDP